MLEEHRRHGEWLGEVRGRQEEVAERDIQPARGAAGEASDCAKGLMERVRSWGSFGMIFDSHQDLCRATELRSRG